MREVCSSHGEIRNVQCEDLTETHHFEDLDVRTKILINTNNMREHVFYEHGKKIK